MLSYEIDQFMRSKGCRITSDDYFRINPILSSQITHMHYDAYTGRYHIYTDDSYHWEFEIV